MSSRILTNLDSVVALRNFSGLQAKFSKSVAKLSSGLRIVSASDDAAGLAIANKIDAELRALNQAIRNAQDGLSMFQTAEGAMDEVESILKRMKELAANAANGTLSDSQRGTLNNEVQALKAEVDRIASSATFNGRKLFDGSLGVAIATTTTTLIDQESLKGTADTDTGSYSLTLTAATKATRTATRAAATYNNDTSAIAVASTVNVNGVNFSFAATDTFQYVEDTINAVKNTTGVSVNFTYNAGVDATATFTRDTAGAGLSTNITAGTGFFAAGNFAAETAGANAIVTGLPGTGATYTAVGNKIEVTVGDLKGLEFNVLLGGAATVNVGNNNAARLQVGATAADYISLTIDTLSAAGLGIDDADVSTLAGAQALLSEVDTALDLAVAARAEIGSVGTRINHTIANLSVTTENLAAAHSRIRDLDVAAETVEFTKLQVLQTAGIAVLAQANQSPQAILALLR